jgi:hypothetical protein
MSVVDRGPLLDRHFALPRIELGQIIAMFVRFSETSVNSF